MSEPPHSLSREDLQRLIDKSRSDHGVEDCLFRKRRGAQRLLDDTMRMLDSVEAALRQVRPIR